MASRPDRGHRDHHRGPRARSRRSARHRPAGRRAAAAVALRLPARPPDPRGTRRRRPSAGRLPAAAAAGTPADVRRRHGGVRRADPDRGDRHAPVDGCRRCG
ncbi:hypothetical protein ACU686_43975 [Yinghuangia aomiensis]